MFWDYGDKESISIPTARPREARTRPFNCVLPLLRAQWDAAENLSVSFNAVPDNPAIAMRASRRQRVDGALETVEGVTLTGDDHFKRLVIFVVANLTCSHTQCFARREVRGSVHFQQQLEIRQESDNFLLGGWYGNTKKAHRVFKRK
jgi:hypothetical protein